MKGDWNFRLFWIAVAGIAVAAGLGLPSLGYPTFGRWLFYGGVILGGLLTFGVLSEWAARMLAPASNRLWTRTKARARCLVVGKPMAKAEYFCVTCENDTCRQPIPLKEHQPNARYDIPTEFSAQCHRCNSCLAYSESDVYIRPLERIPDFRAHASFRSSR